MALRIALETGGMLLVLFTLREVFRDIFHPTRSGNLSDAIGSGVSRLLRHTRLRPAAGPLALIAVLLTWVLLLCVGFAVIYLGLYPQDFTTTAGIDNLRWPSRILHCLYLSMGALCTFETFDLTPRSDWLRLIVAVQGLVGISMITASVSWLVLLYPALARQRGTARLLTLAVEAEERTGLTPDEHDPAFLILLEQNILQARLDLVLFPILVHFYALTPAYTLSAALPTAYRFACEATREDQPVKVRLCGTKLQIALEDLCRTLSARILNEEASERPDVHAILQAYAERER